ncbi:EC1118_1I12_0309p [Saccharomyces cerevisiae EC1118]|uniref:EC1118_1I12_0309p n=1 Tax=Saccharomyces cerevisiae (strain Lalvin EC1118 / Prise de mousse) TaxID=643680 RepID=C8ZAX0_YEAS8|nr:EC1118_1I12_0309p [Saccharomyces cerevisiae EC1118]
MFTNTLAAGLSSGIDFRIVAPSFVTMQVLLDALCNNLSIPFGPNVLFTKSPTAMAPTNVDKRAFSALSSVTWSPNICTLILNLLSFVRLTLLAYLMATFHPLFYCSALVF